MNSEIFSTDEARGHQHVKLLFELSRNWFFPPSSACGGRDDDANRVVLDFGCGDGFYASLFSKLGVTAYALEGTRHLGKSQLYDGIIQWDLRIPVWLGHKGNVMSVEVAEHIDASYHEVFMDTLSRHCSGKLLLTWAYRGQGGTRHVSERDEDEVVPFVQQWGFRFLKDKTAEWRNIAGARYAYLSRSIYLFQR